MKNLNQELFDYGLAQMNRLLSMLDRDPSSETFGCFDRSFWLHRTADFPSAIKQIGFHSIALCWQKESPKNPFFNNYEALNLCLSGINYCIKIQKSDGSFDEWYPNERGWAGPTGYILHALCDTYSIIKEEISEDQRSKIKLAIRKAAQFLTNEWENDVLFNHTAMALLPIFESYQILNDSQLLIGYQNLLEKSLSYFNESEGWGLEYDGPDIGYQTATLSFLARLHSKNGDERIKDICEKALEFLVYFLFPGPNFSLKFGSRQTSVYFPFGVLYWSKYFSPARRACEHLEELVKFKRLILPCDHEDHYLFYRIPEFLESGIATPWQTKDSYQLPFEQKPFVKIFNDAKILVLNKPEYYCLIHLARGGVVLFFNKNNPSNPFINYGWNLVDNKDRCFSSNVLNDFAQFSIEDHYTKITIHSLAVRIKRPRFTIIKMILFKFFMLLFGRHHFLASKIKSGIRKTLMFSKKTSKIHFTRTISILDEQPIISDIIKLPRRRIDKIFTGPSLENRLVPQSRYFSDLDLKNPNKIIKARDLTPINSFETQLDN